MSFYQILGIGILIIFLSSCSPTSEDNPLLSDMPINCVGITKATYPPLDPQAEQWYQEAQTLEKTEGKPRDYNYIAKLYQQAVDKNHWKAMLRLASLYMVGLGVKEDEQKTVELYKRVAELNIPEGYLVLSDAYLAGYGNLKPKIKKGHELLLKAAHSGNAEAQTRLGKSYLGSKTHEKALAWLQCAYQQGSGEAAYYLYILAEMKGNYRDAVMYLREGAKMGNKLCLMNLSDGYWEGKWGLNVDKKRGLCLEALGEEISLTDNKKLDFGSLDILCPNNVLQPY